ncbi:MAG: bifunctional folylpolyglutamate synthase/dihydrofolate synthase [Bifidobacteriaceae bacterium]|nr:bifunctional folylpolyglutamate synthase/dihydrofolate synthase [Bifidobacteriaceae bacterium]
MKSSDDSGPRAKGGPDRRDELEELEVGRIVGELGGRPPEDGFDPTIDRVVKAAAYLGDPQGAYRTVHVAGTNGKTSTARIAEALIRGHGLRTGLLTSPPLISPLERISIDGEPISPRAFIEAWEQVGPVIDLIDSMDDDGPRVSTFEAYTLIALVAFADAPVDVAVIEVGMGGTWDATNVIESDVQAITPISLDHQEWLGHDIANIAAEKAGIMGGRAVIGRQKLAVMEVLREEAAQRGTALWCQGQDFAVLDRELGVGGQLLTLQGLGTTYRDVWLPLHGAHQADNAALALASVEMLMGGGPVGGPVTGLDPDTVRASLAEVSSPGRLQVVRTSPLVVVDAAHNPAGAEALATSLREVFPPGMVGLVGVLGDKDAAGILGELEPVLDRVVLTKSLSPRALDVAALTDIAAEVFGPDRVEGIERLDDALARAMELADSSDAPGAIAPGVIATGSVTVAGEVTLLLDASPRR